MTKHIAVVDDDAIVRGLIIDCLVEAGFRASGCANGQALDVLFSTSRPDLVIVDLNLGDEDGMEIVKRISPMQTVPVVITTGERLEEIDKIIGLELGADDYIEKPFSVRELVARVNVCLRTPPTHIKRLPERVFRFAGWEFNVRLRTLTDPAGSPVRLTPNEFLVLSAFVETPHTVLTREQLSGGRAGGAQGLEVRSVDVVVNRLRRKLESPRERNSVIETERGVGYLFSPSVQQGEVIRIEPLQAGCHA